MKGADCVNKIDLHMHTAASDGSQTPAALLQELLAKGIHTFSVTDHDTIDGALEMEKLVPEGLRYIRGIEFSCISPAGKCHILGYNYDPESPALQAALAQGRALRLHKLDIRLKQMAQRFDIHMTVEELAWLRSQASPGKPHLARIVYDRAMAPTLDDAIKTYVDPCKTGGVFLLEAELAIRAIGHAGGIPVWAHPLGGEGEKRLSQKEFQAQLAELQRYGIRGLECHYSRYTTAESAFLMEQAARSGLLFSAGSDYHGKNKANLWPGKLNADDTDVDPKRITLLHDLP